VYLPFLDLLDFYLTFSTINHSIWLIAREIFELKIGRLWIKERNKEFKINFMYKSLENAMNEIV
jgi:hypothetical protein